MCSPNHSDLPNSLNKLVSTLKLSLMVKECLMQFSFSNSALSQGMITTKRVETLWQTLYLPKSKTKV